MMDQTSTQVGDLIVAQIDTISPDESVTSARRRMESQTARSLIVVEDDRPIGVVQWRALMDEDGDSAIRDVMLTEFPVLQSGMTVDEARAAVTGMDIDFDNVPVVDESGLLIGEVPRGSITKTVEAAPAATERVVSGPEVNRDANQVHLQSGMKVCGASGKSIGTVADVELSPEGYIAQFTVKHGLLGRGLKRLPADLIQDVSGDVVNLKLDQMEFKMLADVGETP